MAFRFVVMAKLVEVLLTTFLDSVSRVKLLLALYLVENVPGRHDQDLHQFY